MKNTKSVVTGILIAFVLTGISGFIPKLCAPAMALMVEFGLEELTNRADCIVEAEVIGSRSQYEGKKIYTYTTLAVKDQIAGESTPKTVTVKQLGGKVGKMRMVVSDSAVFKKGEDIVVFLKPEKSQKQTASGRIVMRHASTGMTARIVGMRQGKYSVTQQGIAGKAVTVNKGAFATREGKILTKAGNIVSLDEFKKQIKEIKNKQK